MEKENVPVEEKKAVCNLTEVQQNIKKAIESKNLEEFKAIFNEHPKEDVNFVDEDNMTPLQQAAYRGNTEMMEILLEKGADVNKCEHEHNYTSLHFGALSGNVDVCQLLLAAGVDTETLNSINRTAAQLAGFIGHHEIVSTIRNFLPKSEVEYYTKIRGTQTKPSLNPEITESFYKFALLYNVHPVKIAMVLQSQPGLLQNIDDVKKVFELMSEKEIKRKDPNEVLSFKFYYISYVLGEISKLIKARKEANSSEEKTFVEVFSKKILKTNKEGNLLYLDTFLRECVREFPYIDSTLFRQMVSSLAVENPPPAFNVIFGAVNRRSSVFASGKCETCGEEKPTKKCAKCKNVSYCDRECQRLHWFSHKKSCARLAQNDSLKSPETISMDFQKILAGN